MLVCGTLPLECIPTHITDTTASLLDNVFSLLTLVQNYVLMSDISDHLPVFSMYDFSDSLPRRHQGTSFSSLKFKDQELALLRPWLADHLWGIFENESDVDSLFNSFDTSLKKKIILDTCYASQLNLGSKRTTPLNLWMTPGLFRSWSEKITFGRLTGPLSHLHVIIIFKFLNLIEQITICFARGPNCNFTIVNSLHVVKTLRKHCK